MDEQTNLRKLLHIDARHKIFGIFKTSETAYKAFCKGILAEGVASALQRFNGRILEIDGECLWPLDWLEDKALQDVLNGFGGPVKMVFNHCTEILDVLLVCRSIDDPVQWKKDVDLNNKARQDAAEVFYREAKQRYGYDDLISNDYLYSEDREKDWDFASELEHIAGRKMVEVAANWNLSSDLFAKRGKNSGLSAKRGWAVKTLAGLFHEDMPDRYSLTANLLSEFGDLKTTRQQVRGILKQGHT